MGPPPDVGFMARTRVCLCAVLVALILCAFVADKCSEVGPDEVMQDLEEAPIHAMKAILGEPAKSPPFCFTVDQAKKYNPKLVAEYEKCSNNGQVREVTGVP